MTRVFNQVREIEYVRHRGLVANVHLGIKWVLVETLYFYQKLDERVHERSLELLNTIRLFVNTIPLATVIAGDDHYLRHHVLCVRAACVALCKREISSRAFYQEKKKNWDSYVTGLL